MASGNIIGNCRQKVNKTFASGASDLTLSSNIDVIWKFAYSLYKSATSF